MYVNRTWMQALKNAFWVEKKEVLTNSTPITPAPMTIIFSGTFFKDRAPVEETTVSSSIWEQKNKAKG